MTIEESRKILKGDISGLEFMTEEVYNLCKVLIDIVDEEGCSYGHDEEIDWAEAFIVSYEDMERRMENE